MTGPCTGIALLLLIAALRAPFVRLRQPVLIAYIVVGIAVGPAGPGLVQAQDQIGLLSQIGVTELLFVVGLNATRWAWPWPSWCCPKRSRR